MIFPASTQSIMSKKSLKKLTKTYVAAYRGPNEYAEAELEFIDEHEDGVYQHANFELRLTLHSGDCGLPIFWEIVWFHTLIYLQATVPEYIEEHCPDPETASEVMGALCSPEFGFFFPSYWGRPPNARLGGNGKGTWNRKARETE
jgi:hypothetical protein